MSETSIAYPKNAVFQLLGQDLLIGKDVTLLNRNDTVASGIVQNANIGLIHANSTVTINGITHGSDFERIRFNNEDKATRKKMTGWKNYEEKATRGGKTRRRKNKRKSHSNLRRSRRSYRSRR